MNIKAGTKLSDAIHNNYLLLPILNRFGIQLGFGDITVEQICEKQEVNLKFFLEIVNSFLDKNYFPEAELQNFPLKLIVDYIKRSHVFYLDFKMPQIEQMINNLYELAPSENKKSFQLIRNFFAEYKKDLFNHIEKEEKEVHPYILKIDQAYYSNTITGDIVELVNKESISKYADDHDNVEDKLYDLKNLIIKYLPPIPDYTLSNAILFELFRLERDLNDHSRIEEKVLVPKMQAIEKQILESNEY
ncbi:MAG: hemerythrin domain-containing protein [Bacteroidales bacterium]|nr:hemerythrin domain-containing protein [Bacteroidales bacterium]MBN2819516.1 hemerythrin domain-containing protein [Bacteroidales bacterium]